jgi:hypothetical protein
MRTVWRVVGWVVLFWVVLVVAFFLFFAMRGGLPSRTPSTHPRYSKNGGCPTSPSGLIKWQPPLGGDSSTCTGSVVGTTATIQYFQSNYDAVLGVATKATVPGNVGGWPVRWYVTTSDNGQLRRDAILPDSDNKPTVHIFVTADSTSDLVAAMKVVEHLKL